MGISLPSWHNLRCNKEERLRNSSRRQHWANWGPTWLLQGFLSSKLGIPPLLKSSCPISEVGTKPGTWSALFFHLGSRTRPASTSRKQVWEPSFCRALINTSLTYHLFSGVNLIFCPFEVLQSCPQDVNWVLGFFLWPTSNISVPLALIIAWLQFLLLPNDSRRKGQQGAMDLSLVLRSFSNSSSSVKSMPFQSLCTFYPSLHETLFCQILIDARSYLLSSRSLYSNGTKRDIKCEKHHKTKINSEEIVMQGVLRGKAWLWAEGSRKPGIWAEFWWMVMFPTGQPFSIFFFL